MTTIDEILDLYEQQIFGQRNVLKLLVTAILADGHVLLEGVPGTGKTKMVRTLAKIIGGDYARVQFTPDLLPSDITGSAIFNMKEARFETLKALFLRMCCLRMKSIGLLRKHRLLF